MAGGNAAASRTEKPTPRRLREARKQGQVARSPDIGAWAGVLAASFLIPGLVGSVGSELARIFTILPTVCADPDLAVIADFAGSSVRALGLAVLPLLVGVTLAGALGGAAQGGARPYLSRLRPRGSRLNPLASAKRMVGPQGMWELAKQLIKTAIIGIVVWRLLTSSAQLVIGSGSLPLSAVATSIADSLLQMMRIVAIAGIVIGVADLMVSRFRVSKELMMSRKDVQDENRQSEGDPHAKAEMRHRARAVSRNRMMAAIPSAAVILVNPTHVAVALRYQAGQGAPRVVAKGAGAVATRIRAAATEHRIPMVEDIPLARTLYSGCEIGQEIPRDLYTAVARILAFVMALRRRGSHAGLHRAGEVETVSILQR